MKNIGRRIKELRKKNNLTQEKLAELLGVTDKAVSKWECDITTPDLALIVPLAKHLHVSTDELLGAECDKADDKRKKHDNAFVKHIHGCDVEKSYWCAREAVADFPEDFKYIKWLADSEYHIAFEENCSKDCNIEYMNDMLDNALRRYEHIIDNCTDTQIVRLAVMGKIITLRFCERIDEAEWCSEFEYPDTEINTVDDVLNLSVDGRRLLQLINTENNNA